MAATDVSSSVMKQCVEISPLSHLGQSISETEFSNMLDMHYKTLLRNILASSLPGNLYGLILKDKMPTMGISLMAVQEPYIF